MPSAPNENFGWVDEGGSAALVCHPLTPFATHFFTTRGWKLGSEGVHRRDEGWADVAAAAAVPLERLVRAHQVHGVEVRRHRHGEEAGLLPDADIIVTDDETAALAIQTADCAPILVVDPTGHAVAAAHAGWRGLAAGAP